MAENSVLIKPFARANVLSSTGAAVRSVAFLDGFLYGVHYGNALTTMAKVPLFGTTSNQTLDIAMTNVQDITTDGTYLYAVEQRTTDAAASTNQLMQIETDGTCTALIDDTVNMRSVVYDAVNTCLYIAAPYDGKILKASGGGIGGNTDSFALNEFITGISNNPGRLWVNESATELAFTTENTSKQIAIVPLANGSPGATTYYNLMGGTGETTAFLYFEDLDLFLYAGPNATRGLLIQLGSLNYTPYGIAASTRLSQGVVLEGNSFIYPDGTTFRYSDFTSDPYDNPGTLNAGAQTTVSSTAVSVLAANPARRSCFIQNVGANNIRVGDSTVTATTGLRVTAGSTLIFEMPDCPSNAIYAIREGGSDSTVLAQEVT